MMYQQAKWVLMTRMSQFLNFIFWKILRKNNLQQAIVQKTIRITRNSNFIDDGNFGCKQNWFALTFQFYRNFNVFVLNFILWPKKSIY